MFVIADSTRNSTCLIVLEAVFESNIRPSGRTCNQKSGWIYSTFPFTLTNNVNYGLILHKPVELIWFYHVSCSFLIRIGCNMVIFTDIF